MPPRQSIAGSAGSDPLKRNSENRQHRSRVHASEELGVGVDSTRPFAEVRARAALEGVEMWMSVFLTRLTGVPAPAAEIAALRWWPHEPALGLAPAVRDCADPEPPPLWAAKPWSTALALRGRRSGPARRCVAPPRGSDTRLGGSVRGHASDGGPDDH
jgi:hypothetical protein